MTTTKAPTGKVELTVVSQELKYVVHCYRETEGAHRVGYLVTYQFQQRSDQKRGVLYVNAPDPEDLGLMERPEYGSTRGDGSEEDKAWRRYNRLEVEIMRSFFEPWLKEAGKALVQDVPPSKQFKFSRKAGCQCGCSPGFTHPDMPRWLNIYVSVVKT